MLDPSIAPTTSLAGSIMLALTRLADRADELTRPASLSLHS